MSAWARHGATSHVSALHGLSPHRLHRGAARHCHARTGAGLITGLADPVVTSNRLTPSRILRSAGCGLSVRNARRADQSER